LRKAARLPIAALVAGAVALGTLAGCGSSSASGDDPTAVTGEFDWKRYDGEQITFLAAQTAWQKLLTPEKIDEFKQLTGITVNVESLPEAQMRQRLQVSLTANSSDYDVYMTSVLQDGARFEDSGWYDNLKPYVENSAITSADYKFDGFTEAIVNGHSIDGHLVTLPLQLETQMLYYRKDLLAAQNIAVPKTMSELTSAAAALTDRGKGVSGFAVRGKGAAAVSQVANFVYGYGSDYTNDQGKAAFNTPEGVEAFKAYGDLVRNYGPSGAVDQSWEELLPLFQQGKLAMWADNSGQAAETLNAKTSTVVDQVGFAPMPAGPKAASQSYISWGASISALSKKKGAAWYFVQWATSPQTATYVQQQGLATGRNDVPFGADVPADFVEAFQSSLSAAKPQLPRIKSVPEARDVIGQAIVVSIQGGDVAGAVGKAAQDFDRIVEAG
ncbi:sugar ABC transporter substrate-binding protein, partial [Micromonospora sp. NPDC051296]|uniref:ABC transporter substrate-binding protein n=1 Tax=Micromonospora sp. NPDC051296 TaxID=3155046 RepID=UPI0034171B9B